MKTPTEQIKEIEKEINGCQVTYCGSIEKCERCIILHAKLQVLKEWEARENEILEIIEFLCKKYNYPACIGELINIIKGVGK